MRKFPLSLILLLFLFKVFVLPAQDEEILSELQNPRSALTTFLANLQDDNFIPENSAMVFRASDLTLAEREDIAIKLKQVLDGEGHYIYLENVPNRRNFVDSTTNKARYIIVEQYPNIYLDRQDDIWQFGPVAVREIQLLHSRVFRFGTDKLLTLLPKIGTRSILGLRTWQHVAILSLLFFTFLVHKLLTGLYQRIINKILTQSGRKEIAKVYILPVARPISFFCILGLLLIFVPVLQLPVDFSKYIMLTLKALLPLFGTIIFYRLVNIIALYLEKVARKTESTLDDQLVPLIRKTLKTFVVVIGSLVILENLNVPILPLLTGLSIGGLAFALAAQDTIKNFFGSLMIFIDKPFQIGDWITSGEIDGNVEEVGFRSTRVRTFRNSVVYVPNGNLADSTIDNHGLRQYRRFYTQIALTYDTPPHLIETFVEGLKAIVEKHPDTRKDYYNIFFNDMAAFSLNIMFYIFFKVPDWTEELRARHEVLLEIMKLAEELGVNFAFPTQTLQMETFPGQPSLAPSYIGKGEAKAKLDEYFHEKNGN